MKLKTVKNFFKLDQRKVFIVSLLIIVNLILGFGFYVYFLAQMSAQGVVSSFFYGSQFRECTVAVTSGNVTEYNESLNINFQGSFEEFQTQLNTISDFYGNYRKYFELSLIPFALGVNLPGIFIASPLSFKPIISVIGVFIYWYVFACIITLIYDYRGAHRKSQRLK